jgi:hypothetical protein
VWVSYLYGFSDDIGGGEYPRELSQAEGAQVYRVGDDAEFRDINGALRRWQEQQPDDAVIELVDSGVYVEQISVELREGQSLQLRAANRKRPVIRLLDWQTDRPDALSISGAAGSRFVLDGLLVTGRGVMVEGKLASLHIRHSTLVPGWTLIPECEPGRPAEPSLELIDTDACLEIEKSIIGAIRVQQDQVGSDPLSLRISDSILDATSNQRQAVSAPGERPAHAVMTLARVTVIGRIDTHAIELGENSLFLGQVWVARRMWGCLRFCYVTPESRTPRRYRCQPDLAENRIEQAMRDAARQAGEEPPPEQVIADSRERERTRVRPLLNSLRFGTPSYCQLATACAEEILRGTDDESEMGAFHNLYNPQRDANLRARLAEYTPVGMASSVVYAN